MIVIDQLVKRYGKTVAVQHLSLQIEAGETFGLLGPNGAGKTTTLAVLAGLLRPDAGQITIGGYDVQKETQAAQRLLGVVPQEIALYPDLTAWQNLQYFAAIKGLQGRQRQAEIYRVLEIVDLSEHQRQRVDRFSGGMKRRLNIAVGLLGDPQVLLLDEPTVGVDPQSRRHILDAVAKLAETGLTIVYTSHYMEEVEYLCRRVAIMDHGRVIAHGELAQVQALAGEAVELRLPTAAQLPEDRWEALQTALQLPVNRQNGELRVVLPAGSRQAPAVLNTLVEHGVTLDGLRLETPNLETVFLALTGRGLRDGGSGL